MISRIVSNTFYKTIRESNAHPELKGSLENHFRGKEFIKNISAQLIRADAVQRTRRNKGFKTKTIVDVAKEFTIRYIKCLEALADKKIESECSRYSREHAGDELKDMEATLKGKSSGIFEDMGIEIAEDREAKLDPDYKSKEDLDPLEKPGRVINIGGKNA